MALGAADTTGRAGQEREVALGELEAGIAFWRSKAAAGWPPDFHNSEYRLWAAEPRDFSDDWWTPFRRRLHDWIALRPATYEQVTTRFVERREALIRTWASHCAPYGDSDITMVTWEQVGAFADLVGEIKPMRGPASPVFTSKFCHFLAPKLFPVVDNEGSGNRWPLYRSYFAEVQRTWASTTPDVAQELRAVLVDAVRASGPPPDPSFPMVNKIVELRLIGRQHPSD